MIGIAFTGSGKTLAFCLPLIMTALEEEMKLPFIRGEGPVGIILCPSRELATQTYENVVAWTEAVAREAGGRYPQLNTLLCIGGISMGEQGHIMSKGLHIVVATPGRLQDMLEKKRFTFDNCKYLCMDEADRMIDLGFEEDVRNIMSFFKVCILSVLYIKLTDAGLNCSGNAKLSYSQRQCLGRFRTLRNNLLSSPCSSISVAPARPTWMSSKLWNT